MQCPECGKPVSPPAPPWRSQWPPYACGYCQAHWAPRFNHSQPFHIPPEVMPLDPLMSWQQAAKWAQFNRRPYVYAITYPSGLPFYVGKGNGSRLMAHAAFLRLTDLWEHLRKPRDEKEAVIWQLAANRDYERYAILAVCQSDTEAFDIEATAINFYGRRERGGILCNATQACEVPPWPMPPMPAIDEVFTDGDYPWLLGSWINARHPIEKGKIVWCPKCDERGTIVRQKPVRDLRCPICFHYFELVDEAKLRQWIPEELRTGYG